jgi:hypothetical protein
MSDKEIFNLQILEFEAICVYPGLSVSISRLTTAHAAPFLKGHFQATASPAVSAIPTIEPIKVIHNTFQAIGGCGALGKLLILFNNDIALFSQSIIKVLFK